MSNAKESSGGLFDSLTSWWGSSATQSEPAKNGTPPPSEASPVPEPQKSVPIVKESRLQKFEAALSAPKINMRLLQDLCTYGVPEKPGLRQTCWLLLLGVLPLDRAKWKETLEKNQGLWNGFVQELVINPRNEYNKSQEAAASANGSVGGAEEEDDHPLSLDRKSTWNAYFKDCELQAEIKKDVSRTFPTLHFFREGTHPHLESLERILFIWCKLNPGVSYVQGMNEVLGPLYYLFAISPQNQQCRERAESEAFFCFMNLMSEVMNNFIKTLDSSEMGIVYQIGLLSTLLQEKDPQLWKDLDRKKLNLQFFAFRQLTLLLSQEFELPDVLRIWDTLFSDTNRFELLRYCCCAMLMLQRKTLLLGDFAENLKLMQSYPPTDIEEIIALAIELATDTEFEPPFTDIEELTSSSSQNRDSDLTNHLS
jgi:hypothetical protein